MESILCVNAVSDRILNKKAFLSSILAYIHVFSTIVYSQRSLTLKLHFFIFIFFVSMGWNECN